MLKSFILYQKKNVYDLHMYLYRYFHQVIILHKKLHLWIDHAFSSQIVTMPE